MRPLIWASLVLVGGVVAATTTVERLSQHTSRDAAPPRSERLALAHDGMTGSPGSSTDHDMRHDMRLFADGRGHFHADPQIDGFAVAMLVDTGASIVALRESDARAAGLLIDRSRPPYRLSTANGIVEAHGATIREFRLGPIILHDVEAVVMPDDQLGKNLLGMSVLNRLRGFEVRDGALWLRG